MPESCITSQEQQVLLAGVLDAESQRVHGRMRWLEALRAYGSFRSNIARTLDGAFKDLQVRARLSAPFEPRRFLRKRTSNLTDAAFQHHSCLPALRMRNNVVRKS
jgi:hypothetical protein